MAQTKASPAVTLVQDHRLCLQVCRRHLPATNVTPLSHCLRRVSLTDALADACSSLDDFILFSIRSCDIEDAGVILHKRARGVALVVHVDVNIVAPVVIAERLESGGTAT